MSSSQYIMNLKYKFSDSALIVDQEQLNQIYKKVGFNIQSEKKMEMGDNYRMNYLLCSFEQIEDIDIIQKTNKQENEVSISIQSEHNSFNFLEKIEKELNVNLDILNCKLRFIQKMSHQQSSLQFNQNDDMFYNFKDFQYVDYQQTMFQQLKVYDTQLFGKVLLIDNMIQFTGDFEDNYTKDLSSLVVNKQQEYEKVLLIGAGDMIIPNYLLKRFKIKKLVQVELDQGVTEMSRKHFNIEHDIQKNIDNGRFELIFEDGSKYVKEAAERNEQFDGIIIDNSDVDYINSPAAVLFSVEFFTDIRKCLKEGASFSQQTSCNDVYAIWKERVAKAGFTNTGVLYSETPEYSIHLPLGRATN